MKVRIDDGVGSTPVTANRSRGAGQPTTMSTGILRSAKRGRLVRFLLAAYLASVPIAAYSPVGADVSQAIGAVTVAAYVFEVIAHRRPIRLPLELLLFGLFIAYTFVGGVVARDASSFLSRQFTLVQLWILAVVMFNVLILHTSGHVVGLQAVRFGVLGAAMVAMMTMGTTTGRLAGALGNANTYGLVSLLGIAASLLLPVRAGLSHVLQGGLILFFAWQTMLSGSRKAILGVIGLGALIAIVILLRNAKRPGRFVPAVLLVTVAIGVGLAWIQNTPYWYRVENIARFASGETVNEGSLYERAELANTAVEVWRLHPVIGVGTDQFRYYAGDYGLRQTYSHSNPLEILANFGIVGVLLYYGIYAALTVRIFSGWVRERSTPRKNRFALIGCIWLTWLAMEVAWVSYYDKLHWITLVLLLVAAYNTRRSDSADVRTA